MHASIRFGSPRETRMRIVISLIAVLGIVALSVAPSELRALFRTPFAAALEHAFAYALLGFILAVSLRISVLRSGMILIIGLSMMAATLEAAQLFLPGRDFRISDIMGSCAGAVIGVGVALLLQRIVAMTATNRESKGIS